ncbi:3-oxo-5-alpha-steroid 4-dehydrogenase 1 [Alligator sinensis]|uniref:3-oxo-5alpha-steroid 4-dehydrogenase (NADP(+)) n=1 Tax=Alligator sinensis TaxID=38654 RepID=A0A3Q0GTR1_ALLSI|nr:3-oxo-5-alpha-steroid 4-dehydrogenase 1 [Alligator sinensis]
MEQFWQEVASPAERRLLTALGCALAGIGLVLALVLRCVHLSYGRYTSLYFGPGLPARAAWLMQELPALLVPLALALGSGAARLHHRPNRGLLGLFLIHFYSRALIFPFLIRGGKPTPLIIFLLAFIFCLLNGYLQGRSLSNYAEYPSDWLKHPCFIVGFAGWLIGMVINIHSDHILRSLREPGETGYKIPKGGMFEYVTGANFFGEILEWFGFALACCTIESAGFAMCALFILASRARQHHEWYLEKFEDYPKSRKIVIPFLY